MRPEFTPAVEAFAPRAELAADPALDALNRAFPPVESLSVTTRLHARKSVFFLKFQFITDVSLAADREGRVRMRGSHPGDGVTLFDLAHADGRLALYIKPEGIYFEGPVSPEGSPFLRHYGLEPSDVADIFAIGARLARSEPRFRERRRWVEAVPAEGLGDGLVRVLLDPESGLPMEAEWDRGGGRWIASYRRWEMFAAHGETEKKWLMPTEIELDMKGEGLSVTVSLGREGEPAGGGSPACRINLPPHPARFALSLPPGVPVNSMGDLDLYLPEL